MLFHGCVQILYKRRKNGRLAAGATAVTNTGTFGQTGIAVGFAVGTANRIDLSSTNTVVFFIACH